LRKKSAVVVILGTLCVAVLAAYYLYPQTNASAQTTTINFAGVTLIVELATTPAAQQLGLSGRDSMPANHGMLFVFQQPAEWGFWMHEMKFSLDIIWFDANQRVVFMEQSLAPCTPQGCPVFTPNTDALYVLEVNAGFVAAHNVVLGDSFSYT